MTTLELNERFPQTESQVLRTHAALANQDRSIVEILPPMTSIQSTACHIESRQLLARLARDNYNHVA